MGFRWSEVQILSPRPSSFFFKRWLVYAAGFLDDEKIPACAGMTDRVGAGMTDRVGAGMTDRVGAGMTVGDAGVDAGKIPACAGMTDRVGGLFFKCGVDRNL